jgi:hypothetical protein
MFIFLVRGDVSVGNLKMVNFEQTRSSALSKDAGLVAPVVREYDHARHLSEKHEPSE